jgi:glycosyltransferase involved in cell wall biosynthesis
LGEYLSTGKPTIVTKVGDIPIYLKDNVNAFLVEPDDNKAFAEKIKFVLDNYENALFVSKEGKKLTQTIFNYLYQSKRLEIFFKGFSQNNNNK